MFKCFSFIGLLMASHLALAQSQPLATSEILARVNDDTITQQHLTVFQQTISQQMPGQQWNRRLLLDELIKASLLYQAAEQQQLDQRPEVIDALHQQRKGLLSTLMLQEISQSPQPSDEQLQAAYEQIPSKEYRIRYLLVDAPEKAAVLIKQLDKNANFGELAQQYSIDPTSTRGGELGWVNGVQVSADLVAALQQLKVGEHTPQAVKNEQGWQVMQLQATRPFSKPAFFQLREQLQQQLGQRKFKDYIDDLKSKATISYSK